MSKPNGNADEIPIAELWPHTPGAGQWDTNLRMLTARAQGESTGYDITWVRSRRAVRVEYFKGGEPQGKPRWVMEHEIREYTERG